MRMMKMKSYKKKWMVCVLIFSVLLGIWTGKGGSAQTAQTVGMGRAEDTLGKSFPMKIKEVGVKISEPAEGTASTPTVEVESVLVESGTVETGAVETASVETVLVETSSVSVDLEECDKGENNVTVRFKLKAMKAGYKFDENLNVKVNGNSVDKGNIQKIDDGAITVRYTWEISSQPGTSPMPTNSPGESSTPTPVVTPTEEPTKEPISSPTVKPTEIPSATPTTTPGPGPTPKPTESANPAPSEEPSAEPTGSPSISPVPTVSVNPIPTPETPGIESGVLEQPGESASPVPSIDPSLFPTIPPITYTIKLDVNGGVVSQSFIEFTAMQIGTLTLPEPTRKGYIFIGWYDGKTRVEKITAVKNITLKAQWAKKELKCTYPNLDLKKAVSSDVKLEKVSIEKKYTKFVKINQKKGTIKAKKYFKKAKVCLMIDGKKVDVIVELKLPQPKVKATEGKMKHYATGAYREFKFSYKNVAAGATKVVAEYKPSNAKKFKKCGSLQNRFKGAYAVVKKGKSVWFRVTVYYGKYASPKSKKIPLKG